MAEGWSSTTGNAALDTLLGTYRWIKMHTGAPGASAASNAAGNTTRKQATFGSAASGAATTTGALTWTNVSTSEDYTHFSAWSAESGGTFGFSGTVTANAVTAGDTFEIAAGDLDVSLTLAS